MSQQIKLFYLLLFLTFSSNCFSQETGYKNLKVGSYLFADDLIDTFIFSSYDRDSFLFRLESKFPQFICDEKVDYIDIKINPDSTIQYIYLYTQEIVIKDVDDFFKNHERLTKCIINTIGKASYYESGNNRSDGRITLGWAFENKNILILYAFSPTVIDKNVKRRYKFVWYKSNGPKKMW